MSELPNASHTARSQRQTSEPKDEKNIEAVVKGRVSERKPSVGKKFREFFFSRDRRPAWGEMGFIFADAAREMIVEQGINAMETVFLGEVRGRSRHAATRRDTYTTYGRFSRDAPVARREEPRREMSRRAQRFHDFTEIDFDSRVDAEEVLDRMYNLLERFEQVTVGDLKSLVGITSAFTDDRYGWVNLDGSQPRRGRRGLYTLDLPQPISLD